MRAIVAVGLSVVWAACERAAEEAPRAPALGTAEMALDLRADGALLAGRALEAPPDSDGALAYRARWLVQGQERRWAFDGVPVLDARFVPGTDGAVVLTAGQDLVWLAGPTASPVRLETEVVAPLAVAAGGRFLAYARGRPPDLELHRFDLAEGRVQVLTEQMAPAWSPALSADGREVMFVSSAEGSPALWRLGLGERPRKIVGTAPGEISALPQGPRAPVWISDALVYELDGGVRVLGPEGRLRRVLRGARAPLAVAGARALVTHGPEGLRVLPAASLVAP